jgi:hypothetical protein
MQHGEAQQSRCDSFRHAQQRRVLHQLCGPANTLAQELYQVCRQLGLGAQQAEELVAPDNRQLGAHHRRCGCRPCHAVEQRYGAAFPALCGHRFRRTLRPRGSAQRGIHVGRLAHAQQIEA